MIVNSEELTISKRPVWAFLNRFEHGADFVMLMLLAFIPLIDAILRTFFHSGIPYGQNFLDALMFPLTFLSMALSSKEQRHMAITVGIQNSDHPVSKIARKVTALLSGIVVGALFWVGLAYVTTSFTTTETILLIPRVVFVAFLPFGLLLIAIRTFPREKDSLAKILYVFGLVCSVFLALASVATTLETAGIVPMERLGLDPVDGSWWNSIMLAIRLPAILLLLVSAFFGTPLFIVLGGMALFFFGAIGNNSIPVFSQAMQLMQEGNIPAVALFALVGYLLSESKAVERLIRLFQGVFGRLPGGIVIVAVVISAFFTSFTGGSGITILALGAILLAILKDSAGNSERFSVGLIAGTGAIGLLFPPSLAIIIYGSVEISSVASSPDITPVNILQIFKAAVIPGLLFVLAMVVMGAIMSRRQAAHRPKVEIKRMSKAETWKAFKESIFELLLPILIVVAFWTGFAGIVETAAFAAVYTLIIEVFVKREIGFQALIKLCMKTLLIFGGILAILVCARGLSVYFVFDGLNQALVDWAQATIKSPVLFLFLLNVVLLIAGSIMEIFSAIVIFVPLLTLVAASFGIDQAHLAVIFLANMSVGFITPPVGLDLFLSSFRFNRPLTKVYRDVLPFFAIQIVVLLLVTYIPWFSHALL